MPSYAIDANGEIHKFGCPEDAKDFLERRTLAYVLFDHWPTESEYYDAKASFENWEQPSDKENGQAKTYVCNSHHVDYACGFCIHNIPHFFEEICDGEFNCRTAGKLVKCVPCEDPL